MLSVLGIDLAASWGGLGSAVLSFAENRWTGCRLGVIVWPKSTCEPAAIASAIIDFALQERICAISLDGPQGWRDPGTPGNFVGRDSERLTRTPGKTGTFGVVKPRTWIGWIQCSIDVFDHLLRTQRAILANSPECRLLPPPPDGSFHVLECFPTSTWRRAKLRPLPGHHIDLVTIQQFARDLREASGLPNAAIPSGAHDKSEHDNLQALLAALPAAGLLGGPCRAVPNGLPATVVAGHERIPTHRTEGIIWDAAPILDPGISRTQEQTDSVERVPRPIPAVERRSLKSIVPDECGIARGVRLFTYLSEAANRGHAVGISYAGFIAYLHRVTEFRDAVGRNYLPSDSEGGVRIASSITVAAGGRRLVAHSALAIRAGMDSFIWSARPPFDRPARAWLNSRFPLPYTREQWLSIFPDTARRLITDSELGQL